VLFIGRWTSALALCLALALSFAAGRLLIGAPSAFLATLIAGLAPAVLLNARRAVFEGVAFLGAALIWYAAARLVAGKVRIGDWMLLGVACGLALAAKHTSLLLIAPIFIALLWYGRARLLRTLSRLALAAIMSALFLLLNPSWWSEPLRVPREVLRLRSATLTVQHELFGRPLSLHERLEALIAFPFGAPQYFEDTRYAWREWLADSIQGYERGLQGVTWYAAAPLVYLALLLGALTLRRERAGALLGIVLLGIGAALLLTNTLMWQRYYLLLTFPLAMLAALGLTRMVRSIRTFRRA
jgi:4-amino-4-deoxy-L-arabinose transferase-like glycosyltransferase